VGQVVEATLWGPWEGGGRSEGGGGKNHNNTTSSLGTRTTLPIATATAIRGAGWMMADDEAFVTWCAYHLSGFGIDGPLYAPYLSALCEQDTAGAVKDFLESLRPPTSEWSEEIEVSYREEEDSTG